MNSLTPFGKTVVMSSILALLVGLVVIVVQGTSTKDCEALYNQYTSASDMGERANIFEKGMDNGCFHNE